MRWKIIVITSYSIHYTKLYDFFAVVQVVIRQSGSQKGDPVFQKTRIGNFLPRFPVDFPACGFPLQIKDHRHKIKEILCMTNDNIQKIYRKEENQRPPQPGVGIPVEIQVPDSYNFV